MKCQCPTAVGRNLDRWTACDHGCAFRPRKTRLKTHLRRVGARTREALQEAIDQAVLTVTAQDAQGWLRNSGYLPAGSKQAVLKTFIE